MRKFVQPASHLPSRSHSAGGSAAESRDSRLDTERQGREQLNTRGALDKRNEGVLERASATETAKGLGGGLKTKTDVKSPNPNPLHLEVWSVLKGGVDSLGENDFGRPWPDPKRTELRSLVAGKPRNLCLKAAREAREIVQSQDRAPNITALFAKKLREREQVRSTVRNSLGAA